MDETHLGAVRPHASDEDDDSDSDEYLEVEVEPTGRGDLVGPPAAPHYSRSNVLQTIVDGVDSGNGLPEFDSVLQALAEAPVQPGIPAGPGALLGGASPHAQIQDTGV